MSNSELDINIGRTKIEIGSQQKNANSIKELHQRYCSGEDLNSGSLAKISHLLPENERVNIRGKIKKDQEEYWQKWTPFRCGLTDEGQPTFDHIIKLLPVRGQFAHFISPQDGDMVVDLMGGSANMAPYIARRRMLAGYTVVDSNPLIRERAEKQLDKLNIPNSHVLLHDLSEGLPKSLLGIIEATEPKRLLYISNWGDTYLDAEEFLRLKNDCFDLGSKLGLETKTFSNMITDGQFDRRILEKYFKREIVPRNVFTCKINALKQAMAALPQMREFGDTFSEVAPIWYPKEIIQVLEDGNFEVGRVDDSLLWGQSTAIETIGRLSK